MEKQSLTENSNPLSNNYVTRKDGLLYKYTKKQHEYKIYPLIYDILHNCECIICPKLIKRDKQEELNIIVTEFINKPHPTQNNIKEICYLIGRFSGFAYINREEINKYKEHLHPSDEIHNRNEHFINKNLYYQNIEKCFKQANPWQPYMHKIMCVWKQILDFSHIAESKSVLILTHFNAKFENMFLLNGRLALIDFESICLVPFGYELSSVFITNLFTGNLTIRDNLLDVIFDNFYTGFKHNFSNEEEADELTMMVYFCYLFRCLTLSFNNLFYWLCDEEKRKNITSTFNKSVEQLVIEWEPHINLVIDIAERLQILTEVIKNGK